jgi:peptidoglycan/xylan/chitin deacetylase (PgdA/CDA1 family)
MNRSGVALVVVLMAILPLRPVTASQAAAAFRISTSNLEDVRQDSLQAIDASKQATEVFPGGYVSPYGAEIIERIGMLMGRLDETDRDALIASKAAAGFDRSIVTWRAHPSARTVALVVRYFRERLLQLELEVTDDYGRIEPVNPARYELFTVAVCSRAGAETWKCGEESLVDVASKHNVTLPLDRAARMAAAENLLELLLSGK